MLRTIVDIRIIEYATILLLLLLLRLLFGKWFISSIYYNNCIIYNTLHMLSNPRGFNVSNQTKHNIQLGGGVGGKTAGIWGLAVAGRHLV